MPHKNIALPRATLFIDTTISAIPDSPLKPLLLGFKGSTLIIARYYSVFETNTFPREFLSRSIV